jgi:hypothetical protein
LHSDYFQWVVASPIRAAIRFGLLDSMTGRLSRVLSMDESAVKIRENYRSLRASTVVRNTTGLKNEAVHRKARWT